MANHSVSIHRNPVIQKSVIDLKNIETPSNQEGHIEVSKCRVNIEITCHHN